MNALPGETCPDTRRTRNSRVRQGSGQMRQWANPECPGNICRINRHYLVLGGMAKSIHSPEDHAASWEWHCALFRVLPVIISTDCSATRPPTDFANNNYLDTTKLKPGPGQPQRRWKLLIDPTLLCWCRHCSGANTYLRQITSSCSRSPATLIRVS